MSEKNRNESSGELTPEAAARIENLKNRARHRSGSPILLQRVQDLPYSVQQRMDLRRSLGSHNISVWSRDVID